MAVIWAGIGAGKSITIASRSTRERPTAAVPTVANDEPELLELLADILALGDVATWGIDLADGGAALAITILLNHGQPVHYISGRAIHRASESYRGEGRTDAKDAAVIADQVLVRRDLRPLHIGDDTVTDLKILTGRRMDLVADRTRTVDRLRARLTGVFPGLERTLDLTNIGPAHPADRLPDLSSHPPNRYEAAGELAAQPSRRPPRPARRDRRSSRRTATHQPARREGGR